jgi:hypothetical protein
MILIIVTVNWSNSVHNNIGEARQIIEDTYCINGTLSYYDGRYNIIACCKDNLTTDELSRYVQNKKEYLT